MFDNFDLKMASQLAAEELADATDDRPGQISFDTQVAATKDPFALDNEFLFAYKGRRHLMRVTARTFITMRHVHITAVWSRELSQEEFDGNSAHGDATRGGPDKG